MHSLRFCSECVKTRVVNKKNGFNHFFDRLKFIHQISSRHIKLCPNVMVIEQAEGPPEFLLRNLAVKIRGDPILGLLAGSLNNRIYWVGLVGRFGIFFVHSTQVQVFRQKTKQTLVCE